MNGSGRLRVGLVFGGRSGEHEVSVLSARSVARALRPESYEVVAMAIDRSGRWADPATAQTVLTESGDRTDQVLAFTGSTRLDPRLTDGSVDVVAPILHGPFGEDGTVQGLCEVLDLPYLGCAQAGCAVAMDKVLTKRLLAAAGLATPEHRSVTAHDWQRNPQRCLARCLEMTLPLFVKPARLGSSVGVSKCKEPAALSAAIGLALGYDDLVIVEEGIDAREIEVAVLDGDPPVVSVPGEIVPGREFYDYVDKYLGEDAQLLAPAPLDDAQTGAAQALARAAFAALGCDGMARVDLFLDRRDGSLLVNELNVIPGFTAISMFPRLLALTGVAYPELLDRLVELALGRTARRRRLAASAQRPLDERARGA